eukprot:maker-scaffold1040_size68023-snap-gene-0.20 protein:Tk07636 transcript:maker-scaffold1040_size68023-snap-gene-0.20-mRNA-1 annotation:"forkhead box protein n1"
MDGSSSYMVGGYHSGVSDSPMTGLTLHDMIDTDIKAEFDDVLQDHGIGFATMESLDLITELDASDALFSSLNQPSCTSSFMAPTSGSGCSMGWSGGVSTAPTDSYLSSTSMFSNYMDDMASTVMVNPNNVMPVTCSTLPAALATAGPTTLPHTLTATPVSSQGAAHPQHQQVHRLSVNTQFSPPSPMATHSPQMTVTTHSPGGFLAQNPHSHQGQPTVHIIPKHQGTFVDVNGQRVIKTLKVLPPASSPMQQVPSPGLVSHVGLVSSNGGASSASLPDGAGSVSGNNSNRKKNHQLKRQQAEKENGFPKPAYSYSCLIALALKNSQTGSMSVSEIYKFMCEHFPYFKTAPSGWKNSVRHNLSLNKCFEKIEKPAVNGSNQRKGCLWAMNPAKVSKMDEEVLKWSRKDPMAIKKGMLLPHTLESLERGEMIKDYNANSTSTSTNSPSASATSRTAGAGNLNGASMAHNSNKVPTMGNETSEDEEEPRTPTSVSSQGSQGYDSGGSDFVDIEGFTAIPDSSLPELNLQANGGIYEDLGEERIQFGGASNMHGATRVGQMGDMSGANGGNIFFSPATEILGNYSITPTGSGPSGPVQVGLGGPRTLVMQKLEGQKVFSI